MSLTGDTSRYHLSSSMQNFETFWVILFYFLLCLIKMEINVFFCWNCHRNAPRRQMLQFKWCTITQWPLARPSRVVARERMARRWCKCARRRRRFAPPRPSHRSAPIRYKSKLVAVRRTVKQIRVNFWREHLKPYPCCSNENQRLVKFKPYQAPIIGCWYSVNQSQQTTRAWRFGHKALCWFYFQKPGVYH